MTSSSERNLPVLQSGTKEKTNVGNYFVSNYPAYSFWTKDHCPSATEVLDQPAIKDTPLGLYIHIPFCRKRCDFCYFKVYTDKNSGQIRRYLDAVIEEMRLLAERPYLQSRQLDFVYFGGGTPSYLSVEQLQYLFNGLQQHLPWVGVKEVSFECEPGTLQEKKIRALREMGITRLSLGVESFNPELLELNNRAHRAKEIHKAYAVARDCAFPQINIDLIAGMVGETDDNWKDTVEQAVALNTESVTLYQMEIPYNTTIYKQMRDTDADAAPVADWDTKRRWVSHAMDRFIENGYSVGSAYTMTQDSDVGFLYRDALWHGADMVGVGVSSISHMNGVHHQNEHQFEPYVERVEANALPIKRALPLSQDERFIREFILQFKLGRTELGYFSDKFNVDVTSRYATQLAQMQSGGLLTFDSGEIRLTRAGLLRADSLLPNFFLKEHQDARYA